MNSKVRHKS